MARKRMDEHERNMQNALAALSDKRDMSLRDVAKKFNVPKSDLGRVYFEPQKNRIR